MKKLLLLACLLLMYNQYSYSQDYYGENLNSSLYSAYQIIGNPSPQSPDVAAFQKVNFVPVSNYTGRVNVTIPIYTINVGSMTVPISLSYNSSGVKVSDMASNVGLNWSLNAGGVLSKMTKGIDDFYPLVGCNTLNRCDDNPGGWLSYTNGAEYTNAVGKYHDAQPDIFTANAPGLSTKYVYKNSYFTNAHGGSYVANRLPVPIELEHKGNKIDVTGYEAYSGLRFGIASFINTDITSMDGIKYSFGSKETSRHYTAFKSKYSSWQLPRITVSGYRLDKMYDSSTNQVINFEYEQYSVNFADDIIQKGGTYNGGTHISFISNGTSKTTYPTLQRLKKIIFDKGTVEFIYGLNRIDNPDEKALTEVKIKDKNGVTIKHVKLSYGYFQSNISVTTAQSKRLRLDRVYEVDANLNELPGHIFTYNTMYQMPPRGSYAHDFLGYNNGSYNSSLTNPVPKYYLNYYNSYFDKKIKLTPFYDSNDVAIPGNFSLEANVNFAKTYSLKKVTFPTGGFNEYEYELNTFFYNSSLRKGGGLRIKTQTLNDGNGGVQILDYQYDSGSIANLPVFGFFKGSLPNNGLTFSQITLGIDTFLSPQSQIEFTQGSFVGYGRVTVKNRIENGYKKYFYTSPASSLYKNIYPIINVNSNHSASANWKIMTPPSLLVDMDFLRGKLKLEETYNKDNEIRMEVAYTYTQKTFANIHLKYLNKSSSNPLDNCYYDNGTYKLHQNMCGGYWEEIDLPVARDLLTTIVTKDFPVGNIVYTQGGMENVPYTFKTTKRYEYDYQLPLLLKETKEVTTCESTTQGGEQDCIAPLQDFDHKVSKEFIYPLIGGVTGQSNSVSSLPFANDLIAKNKLSTPLRIEFKNKDGQTIAKEDHLYKNFPNSVLALEKVNFIARDGSITNSDKVTKRDIKGRIIEYLGKDGIYTARIYGYDSDIYLVAEVVNSTYSNAIYALQNSINTPFNQSTFSNDTDIKIIMNELRNVLPNARITSYTYKHLVGINSITDARGRTTNYQYDSFNRLKSITDHEGKVLSKNEYHYKNQ